MNKKQKDDKYMLRVKLAKEDYELLVYKCNERGIDKSNYIRELIRGTNRNSYYSVGIKGCIEDITYALCQFRDETLSENGKAALNILEKGTRQLWRYSR